jgi:hypothetical protein
MGEDVTTFAGVVKTQLTDEENGVVGYAADAAEATKKMKDEMKTQFTLAVGEADTF